jgi:hypothetical protein
MALSDRLQPRGRGRLRHGHVSTAIYAGTSGEPGETAGDGVDDDANGIDDVNSANFIAYEVLFERRESPRERHRERPLRQWQSIYWDVNRDGTVTRSTFTWTDPSGRTIRPGHLRHPATDTLERHAENVNANNVYDTGEAVYVDRNNDGMVDVSVPPNPAADDILISGPAQANGAALVKFLKRDFIVDPGDAIYFDADGDEVRSAADTELSASSGPAPPNGGKFERFHPLIRYVQNAPANGRRRGESVYFDRNNNKLVDVA